MKEALALLSNDWHLSKDNIDEFNKNWDEMLLVCQQHDIKHVCIGGDFFTSRASQTLATLLAGKRAIEKGTAMGIEFIIAEGNHDKADQESEDGYNHLWKGLKSVVVVDNCEMLCWPRGVSDYAVLIMSYFPEGGSFLDRLQKAEAEWGSHFDKGHIILYIHEGIHGALGDFDIPGELRQEPFEGFKSVLCGHYHNRVKIPNTCIEYIGSTRQANFGEDEEKGYTILYSDGSYEFVKNEVNTRYRTIEINASSIDGCKPVSDDSRYKYRVKVKCTENQAKNLDKQKLIDLGFNKVEVVAEKLIQNEVSAADIHEKYDKLGIRKEYQNYCNDQAIDSKLGMKYLEG